MAGANEIATSTVPVIDDDDATVSLDREMLQHVEPASPLHGPLNWRRAACVRHRLPGGTPDDLAGLGKHERHSRQSHA